MSIDDCYYYFMKGLCTNRYCQYRHNPRPKMKQCHYWATSGCYNHKCPYLHNNYELTRAPPAAKEQAKGLKDTLCTFHMHGKCTKGDTCPFKHESESATQIAVDEGNSDKIQEAAEILKKYSTSAVYVKKRKAADAVTEHATAPDDEGKVETSVAAAAVDLLSTANDGGRKDDEIPPIPSVMQVVEETRESVGTKKAKKTVAPSMKMK